MSSQILYILLSALPMFVCGFWMIVLLLIYHKSRIDQKILFWFMLTATILYFSHFVFFNKIYNLIPITDTLYNFATLAVYPIYFLYIISLTGKVQWKDSLILLPAVILSLVIGILYIIMPSESINSFLNGYEYSSEAIPNITACIASQWMHNIVKAVFAIQLIPILIYGLKKIKTFKDNVEDYFSNTEESHLKEVRLLLIFFVVTSLFSFAANLIGRVFFADSIALIAIPSILFSALLFAVGYVGIMQKFSIKDLMQETIEEEPKTETDTTPEPADNTLKKEMDKLMDTEHLYLQPNLTMSDVAFALNTNRTYIYNSLIDNETNEHIPFSDYVNNYRIQYSLNLLKNNTEHKPIEEIIYECGFASKTAFYKNFKKIVGMTPNQYIKTQQ